MRPILNYTAFFQECFFFEISVFFFQELHKILAVALSLERSSNEWAATGVSKLLRRTRRRISLLWATQSLVWPLNSDIVKKNSSDTKANGIADFQQQNRKSKARQRASCEGKDVVCWPLDRKVTSLCPPLWSLIGPFDANTLSICLHAFRLLMFCCYFGFFQDRCFVFSV